MFEHAVEYNQQFAHGRDQRHLFRLASCQQPLVEVPDSRVVAAGYQRSHVEDGPHPGASAPDGAFAPQGATVPVVGGHAHKGGNLPAIQRAQLWQIGQQSEGDLLSDTGNGAEQSSFSRHTGLRRKV